jgi:hypothetical protein
VKDSDLKATTMLPEVKGDDSDLEMESGWDEVVKNNAVKVVCPDRYVVLPATHHRPI